ncbi:hypothetical protein [Reyranella sp.]|uniref:hypothetical protein n=1 Tax=Reyranella sp. TaxID=1929291 RepID=UPI002719E48D|nr:hypothetical protein [Reyranella sp.]MDO8976230.1 hypothetical protein [Reyranella sp.]MDP3241316.1 hypothetical protein [Reyranella sp.]
MMKRPTILLTTLLAMTAALVATAQAQDVWGAVATDNERLFGVSAGMATREAAEQSAWNECNARVPSNSCTIRSARCFE